MNRQKHLKIKVLVQKLIDDVNEYERDRRDEYKSIFLDLNDDFYKYSNEDLFKYLDIDYKELILILEDLKNRDIIFQYECLDTEEAVKKNKKEGLDGYRTSGFSIDRAPKYGECVIKIPDDFLQRAQAYLARPYGANETTPAGGLILYLSQNGTIWYGDKEEKHHYSMKKNSERFFIFKYLVDNSGFQDTTIIARELNIEMRSKNKLKKEKTSQNVRTEIGKMRVIISRKLEIHDLILTGDNDNGYGLNPNYKIRMQK